MSVSFHKESFLQDCILESEADNLFSNRSKSKNTVTGTQHVEEPVATADTTHILDASESAEELRNQPSTIVTEKVTILNLKGIARNHSQTSLGESGEDKGDPRPDRESEPTHSYPIFSEYSESALGSDTLMFIMHDIDSENSRLYKDLKHPAHESQTIKVPELHLASRVTESQNKRLLKVLTFEGTELSPSVFLRKHTGDPSLHYKFTFSTNHLMQEHETKVAKNKEEDPLSIDSRI
ncbi:hypothetical protein Tco_0121324 [Tanacetum coccineum]